MHATEILIRLRHLHSDLAVINDGLKEVNEVDFKTIDALGQLATDIGAVLDSVRYGPNIETNKPKKPFEVMDQINQFKANHPRVENILLKLRQILMLIGI
ncbi:DUF4404 family protein [Pirellulaceae bacterium]|nr:DUF4404 family protein [Pirellulaceae bacterium]MDB4793808.1 DUF4404 family protein [Pirellulaceae bacterium]